MKRTLLFLITVFYFFSVQAQPKIKDKKYPSLLWEISGNGLKKPSHLIGTMHVSSKLAFHLPDSFYLAVKAAQVVALETNPETWQDDMNKYDFTGGGYNLYGSEYGNYFSMPSDYLSISTLKFYKYDKKIESALYSNPSTINSLLYRTYGNESSDFEEDTYLDMYIFQCGKKWGKTVTGVEDYGESMRLMMEAYKDAAKDKNKKERSYDGAEEYTIDKLQDAYRTGNLDLLDSINKFNSFSAAFDEKFLYKRNEIQANSIDSILKSGSTLFVGVGAAHLPGERGVIEMLRRKGYKVRPVKMGERDSHHKDIVDKIRVPVVFKTETADDGFFKVDIPGKFYKQETPGYYSGSMGLDQKQFADMSNGSYYMVTRIMTNAWMWGHTTDNVYKSIDSLLYENVPGKILSKTTIYKNGYKGFDIANRTRRGDMQRYNIFVTPFEIIFFKMSGNGDYVKNGDEATKFFGSIQFKEFKNGNEPSAWKKYSPPYGGFAIDMPHEPFISNDGSWLYDSEDKTNKVYYRVIRTDIHNYHFVEEDTFDLSLLNESFMASEFIDSQMTRKQTNHKGYPALDAKFRDKNGSVFLTRFIIQGPHYYTLVAHGKQETPAMSNFLNSFEIKPFVYNEAKAQKDTSLYFSVTTPVYPEDKKIKLDIPRYSYFGGYGDEEEDEESETDLLEAGAYRNKIISNDTTGEKIYVSFYRSPRYYYTKDSAELDKDNESFIGDSTWVYKLKKKTELPNKMKVWEAIVTDTGSSRTLWTKVYYKDGIGFSLATQSDTLTQPSPFVKKFFESFAPADTLKGVNPFQKKSALFFSDFLSADTLLHKRALKSIGDIDLDSTDLPKLKQVISSLNWKEKKYLDTKESFVGKLSGIKTNASADYLKELYYALDDTVQVQYTVLSCLLAHQTSYAYNIFKNIINTEPPVLGVDGGSGGYSDYSYMPSPYGRRTRSTYSSDYYNEYSSGNFLGHLFDSLKLTKTILPDLLPLMNLDDYKSTMMELLSNMVDSNLVKPSDYQMYFSKFFLEAKQELKKQAIAEKQKAIEMAELSKEDKKDLPYYMSEEDTDYGNDDLSLYATLLVPFWETNGTVQPLIQQMLASSDKRLKYNTMLLMIQHNKPYPDTMLSFFGGLDEYRYELYSDLKDMKKQDKFPSKYNNHLDLGKSALLDESSYGKPDTLVYIDRLPAEYKSKKGFIYFYKYKDKKDDMTWKLAMVGLTPEDPKQFEYEDSLKSGDSDYNYYLYSEYGYNRYNFTDMTDTKIEEDEPISKQLNKALKKMLYSRRDSAKEFYEESEYGRTSPFVID
ncbi:MAG: TraB/GumN family protein [Chitinophagaceae bacterium]|nr:TraB/GumN family protein [Chitinophagaceae bacterium]